MPRRVGKSWRAVAGLAFVADAKSVRARAVAPSDSIECFRMMLSRSPVRAGVRFSTYT
jgi:hypothetical protein